jgi:hypothetical protein
MPVMLGGLAAKSFRLGVGGSVVTPKRVMVGTGSGAVEIWSDLKPGGTYELNVAFALARGTMNVVPLELSGEGAPSESGVFTLPAGTYTAALTFTATSAGWRSDYSMSIRTPGGDVSFGNFPGSYGTSNVSTQFVVDGPSPVSLVAAHSANASRTLQAGNVRLVVSKAA